MAIRKAYIHIGTGKTGSSTIQRLLAGSHSELTAQGVSFLGRMLEQQVHCQKRQREVWQENGGWPRWLESVRDGGTAEAYIACMEEQLDALGAQGTHTVIMSNEGFFEQAEVMKPVIAALAARGIQVEIVAVVRRHFEWAFSAYLQWGVRHKTMKGRVLSFSQWLTRRPPLFAPALKKWSNCPGVDRLILINYSAVPDVVPDFLKRLGLELDYNKDAAPRVNAAASVLEAVLLANYHDHREDVIHPVETAGLLERLRNRGHVLRRERNLQWSRCTENDIQPLVDLCKDDLTETNELLRAHGQPLFADEKELPPTLPSSITGLALPPLRQQEELLAALLSIVVDLDQQVRSQDQQLRQLRREIRGLPRRNSKALEKNPQKAKRG